MAVGGPVLLGEGPIGLNPSFKYKGPEPNKYRDINKEVCKRFNVPYMDIKRAFEQSLPWYWFFFGGVVTEDGEHQNERGTEITANMSLMILFTCISISIMTNSQGTNNYSGEYNYYWLYDELKMNRTEPPKFSNCNQCKCKFSVLYGNNRTIQNLQTRDGLHR